VGGARDAGLFGQDVDRLQAAEMVLVVVLEDLLGEPFQLDAVGAQLLEDLVLADRMGLVEVDDRLQLFALVHRSGPGGRAGHGSPLTPAE
jgi:hypothetical protein